MNALLTIALAFAYRIRGGGFFHMLDFEYRILWGCALGLAYIFMNAANPDLAYAFLLPFSAYAAQTVPHAYDQNAGRWPMPQNRWPSCFLPDVSQDEWTAWPLCERSVYNFAEMQGTSLFQALIVFVPYMATQYAFHDKIALYGVIRACAVLIIGQPLAYELGWYCPLNFPSLQKRSTEWGEFLTGFVWGLALWLL